MKQHRDHDSIPLHIKTQSPTEILMECCRKQVQGVVLTLEETRVYYHARLFSVADNSLCLRLTRKLFKTPATGSTCYLSFPHQNSSLSFFSNVLEYRHNSPDKHAELILDIRSGVMRSEPRLAYRVNVTPGSKIVVNLITNDGINLNPRVRDLSLIGIGVDFTGKSANPKLEAGSSVEIDIRFPPDQVRLKGEIRHRIGLKYGVSFPTVNTQDGINPPPALKRIVSALEREWLREINCT